MTDASSLRVTLHALPAVAWLATETGALECVNARFADAFGIPTGHALRAANAMAAPTPPESAFTHACPQDAMLAFWSACIQSRSGGRTALRIHDAHGGYRHFLCCVEPLLSNERLHGWLGMAVDIHQYAEAEYYLAEGQRLGQSGSWAFDVRGFQYWSASLYQIHGLAPQRSAPTIDQYLALVHPDDRDFVSAEIARMFCGVDRFDFTKRIVRPDGNIRHIRCVGTRAREGFIGTGIDVTEQEVLLRTVRDSEKELRQILDLAPQMVVVLGAKGERLYLNRTAIDYLGMSEQEWLSGDRRTEIHPDDRERSVAFEGQLSRTSTSEIELRALRSDGTYRWFLARYNPICDDQGELLRWFITGTDIEERKKAEERLRHENVALREEIEKISMFEEIIGTSPALIAALSRVSKVASSDSTVLISGETGTGKELVARAIHRRSRRASRSFVAVNCAAIPRDLIVSELFGHEKGAFTGALQRRIGRFELADGGTLFLDEVGELTPDVQIALLRVLQEREFERIGGVETIHVDVRIIAATNRNLVDAVAGGSFRQDLFYRLNVFPVSMPALRERRTDIRLLALYFIERYARNMGKTYRLVNRRTLEQLDAYSWPGNVRELQNVIERSVIVCEADEFLIDESWLLARATPESRSLLPSALAAHEKTIIEDALRECGGRVFGPSGAAVRLGLPRSTLESKIRALQINKQRFRQTRAD
jgi:PAS domain S-box-containing protein